MNSPCALSPRPCFLRLDAYLLKALLTFVGVVVSLVTLVLFFSDTLFDTIKEMQALGLPLGLSLYLVVLQLPTTLVWALPPAVFLSVLFTYSQFNQQFELIALRVQGVSLWRLARPAVLLGLLMALVGIVFYEAVIPVCQQQTQLIRDEWGQLSKLTFKRDGMTLPVYSALHELKTLVYAQKADGQTVQGLTLVDKSNPTRLMIVQAATAHRQSNGGWHLSDVSLLSWKAEDASFVSNHIEDLQRKQLLASMGEGETRPEKLSPATLTFPQLLQKAQQVQETQTATSEKQEPLSVKFYIQLWDRVFQPLLMIALAFLGVPLALDAPRSVRHTGLILGIGVLFVVFVGKAVIKTMADKHWLAGADMSTHVGLPLVVFLLVLTALAAWRLQRKSYQL